ncbi:DUF4279 domain-containing protein [Ralstonia mannitolilytica]|uniref:DUF4279 domain-containing protein n=1 Tax=Ralstonia mannitolilytica TaxID=105219 RepID=UPI000CEF1846|nr:DUF4279 domain-containing protein [Ralstonia mannitolilytica]MBU9579077.1 DUF4279 domain-containing protein [Ralstonia mannitolilytica]
MAHLSRSRATLRIAGDDLDPEEISRQLGCKPTTAQRKGEAIVGYNTGQARIAQFGMWRLQAAPREPEDIDGQISEILGHLSDDLEVWRTIGQRYKVDLFCGLFMKTGNEGLLLSPGSLLALAVREIEIGFDIYGPDGEVPRSDADI